MAQKRFAAPLKCAHIAEYEVNSRTVIYTFQSKWLMRMQQEPVAVPHRRRGGGTGPVQIVAGLAECCMNTLLQVIRLQK